MRSASLGSALAALCGAALLAGCGKGSSSISGGPVKRVVPLTAQGAVSVVTRNTTRLGGADPAIDAASVARAVYPALTPSSRPEAVVLVAEGAWPAALAASSLAGAPLRAPLLFSRGDALPAVTAQTLKALSPRGARSLGGVQVLRIGNSAQLGGHYLARTLAGAPPASAAAAIERELRRASGRPPRQVIIVPEEATPALVMPAAGLAAESAVPILFVNRAGVPAASAAVLAGARPSMYVIDSPQVGRATLAALRRFGPVSEITAAAEGAGAAAGSPAVANSIAVARFTDAQFGWGVKEPGHGLVFANSARPLDAPAAAPLSSTGDYGPLLLTESAAQVPPPLAVYLGNIQPAYTQAFDFRPVRGVYNHGWLIGDERAISALAQVEIDSLLEISPRRQSAEPSVSQLE